MSIGGALKGFVAGYETASEVLNRDADTAYRKALADKERPATDKNLEGRPDPLDSGGGAIYEGPGSDTTTTGSVTPGDPLYRDAIAGIESAGTKDPYRALGIEIKRRTGPDRAYGRYQVMASNIPSWTKEALGELLTPQQFLASNEAQDKVFDYKFGQYVEKYGERGAASMWYTGSPNEPNRTDPLGKLTGKTYTDKFMSNLERGRKAAPPTDKEIASVDPTQTAATGKSNQVAEQTAGPAPAAPAGSLLDTETRKAMNPKMLSVIDKATADNPGLFALNPDTKTIRSEADQRAMVDKGYSQTMNSKHLAGTGKAVDLVPINPATGKPDANYTAGYDAITQAMRKAAADLGIKDLQWGGDWKSFKDRPHWQVSKLEGEGFPTTGSTAFAARGGAIPEPRQFAEGGGTEDPAFGGWGTLLSNNTATGGSANGGSDTGSAADFNTGFGNATFTEENAPVAGWFDASDTTHTDQGAAPVDSVLTTQTNTQQADDAYNPLRDTTQDVVAETPAADTGTGAIPENPIAPTTGFYELGTAPAATVGFTEPAAAPAPVAAPKGPQWTLIQGQGDPSARLMGNAGQYQYMTNPNTGKREKVLKGSRWQRNYAQGGAIPDPAEPVQKYAGGGSIFGDYWTAAPAKATSKDERFKQLLAIESRGGGSQHGGQDSARDRAARRLNREYSGRSSTAYRPGKGGGEGGGKKIGTGPGTPDPITTKGTPEISDPHINVTPENKNRLVGPDDRAPPRKKSALEEGFEDRARPAADRPPSDKPASSNALADEMANRDVKRPDRPGPVIPEPGTAPAVSSDPDVWKLPLGADPTVVRPDAIAQEEQGPPIPPKPVVPEPPEDAWTAPPGTVPSAVNPPTPAPAPTPPAPAPAAAAPAPAPPVIPDQIDLRPAPISTAPAEAITPPVAPEPPAPTDHAALVKAATAAIAAGKDPGMIAEQLQKFGVPQELWPLQAQNALLGMARGGAVPEPGEQGYNEAVAEGAFDEPERLQATPRLRNDVATALDSGVKAIKKVFLGGDGGAMPTPDDAAMKQQGAQRLASGEGAATSEEIQQIDQKIDPDGRLDEASRAMTRLAKTTQWYLEQGRPEDAAASAMSLMQAGAQKFGRIGSMAKAAYGQYLQTKDPKHLQATVKFLEKAYEQIPDGANIEISINPDTQTLQVAKTNADGEQELREIQPQELPGLIQQAQSGSFYWQEIFKLADPKGYENKLTTERQVAEDARTRTEWDRQHGITSKEEIEKEERTSKRDIEKAEREAKAKRAAELEERGYEFKEHDRQALFAAGLAAAAKDKENQGKRSKEQIQADVATALGPATAAFQTWKADKSDENKAALDAAASELYRASGMDDEFMKGNMLAPGYDFTYVGEASATPEPKQAPDGKFYVPDPDRPGKYLEVKPPAAAEAVPVS